MQTIDGARCFRAMVAMRDGVRLNTFVFLPQDGGPRFPVILHRTPYGITLPPGEDVTDCTKGWLPDPKAPLLGAILRGWREIVRRGYAAVYQDCRGRYGSEGEDHVYGDDATDGYDTLEWISGEPWTNHRVGLSGSSAASTTALAAASQRHPTVRAFFAQVGSSSIYDDVVYEGQSIEMERLWLWVAGNIAGLSASHREAIARQRGLNAAELAAIADSARACYAALTGAGRTNPPFIESAEWMRLPLTGYPDFSVWQPYLDEILRHPAPDSFRARHNFRSTIEVPGFHVTTWFDIFQTSVLAAFKELHRRLGSQRLWIGPNGHSFVYQRNFWPRDPYFEWFDYWLKGERTPIIEEPPVFYSPRAWVADESNYVADDWRHSTSWPPPEIVQHKLYLTGDGRLSTAGPEGGARSYLYDPKHPIPTLGGRNMMIAAGPRDQRPVQALENYGLSYRSELLEADLTIAGSVDVTLHVQSNCRDTDFVAKLIELHPDGRAMLLMDGVVRAMYRDAGAGPKPLSPDRVFPLTIHLGDIHHTFSAGSRLQVDISSSNFPRRVRNTNSGNPILADDTAADIHVATNSVHHSKLQPSLLVLPVVPVPPRFADPRATLC
jgi:putative CocE/NonD family hydrolase